MVSTDLTIQFASPQRRREFSEPWHSQTLAELADGLLPEHGGYTAAVNGQVIESEQWSEFIVPASAQVTFVPDFGFLAALLMWALPTIFTSTAMTTAILGPITWTMVFNAIGYLGASFLINSLMPKPKAPKPMGGGSPAYTWDPQTTQEEGRVIPRHYGKFRVHGNIISAYTRPTEDGRQQLIYALCAFADGPVATVDATNVELGGQPVGNYSGLSCETRRGLLNQTATTNFQQTRLQFRINHKLTYSGGAWTFELPDDDYDNIEVTLRFDLWYRHKSGAAGGTGAGIKIEISEAGEDDWTEVFNETVSDSLTDTLWKEYDIGEEYELERGTRYELRFTKTNTDSELDRLHNLVWVESVTEVIDVAFTYPGMVLAEISGVPSEDFGGVMDISALLEYRVINKYNGTSWSLADDNDNPAWVLWDMWTLPIISGDGGDTAYAIEEYLGFGTSRLNATNHYELAQFCDTMVPDGEDGTEKRITFNGIFDSESNMWDLALQICEVARCLPVWDGNTIKLAINKAKTRVGIISVGNILEGSFEESFAPMLDAASEIEAQFNDVDRDYERRTLPFHNDNITTEQNKVTMDLLGLVKQTEIVRHVKHRLKHTELRQRTIVASCGIDALFFEIGDLIGAQEDVPDWNELGTRGGGRLLGFEKGETNDVVIIDHDVQDYIQAGQTYELVVRLRDSSTPTIKTVVSVSSNRVTISGHYSGTKPRIHDLWALGKQNLVLKDFTIEAIEQSGNLQRKLTLLEYDADVFDTDDETPIVPVPSAVPAKTDRWLTRPASIKDLRMQAPAAALEFPTIDIPLTNNLEWDDDTPNSGYISWSAEDGENPILFTWKGSTYEITADNSNKKFIYWDENYTTSFQSSDTLTDAIGSGKWLMCYNDSGTANPAFGRKVIHGGIIQAGTITAAGAQIANLTVGTLQIQDQAVTIPSDAYTESAIQITPAGSEITVQQITLTATGAPIHLIFSTCQYSGISQPGCNHLLYRDSTKIFESGDIVNVQSYMVSNCFCVQDTPDADEYTYYLKCKSTHALTYIKCRSILALEVKK